MSAHRRGTKRVLGAADAVALVGSVGIPSRSPVDPVAAAPVNSKQAEVASNATRYVIVTSTAIEQPVAALLSGDAIGPAPTSDRVVTPVPAKRVVATPTGDHVGPTAAADHIVTAQSGDVIASTEAADDIVAGCPSKPIRSLGASDRALPLAGSDAHPRSDQHRSGERDRCNPADMCPHLGHVTPLSVTARDRHHDSTSQRRPSISIRRDSTRCEDMGREQAGTTGLARRGAWPFSPLQVK